MQKERVLKNMGFKKWIVDTRNSFFGVEKSEPIKNAKVFSMTINGTALDSNSESFTDIYWEKQVEKNVVMDEREYESFIDFMKYIKENYSESEVKVYMDSKKFLEAAMRSALATSQKDDTRSYQYITSLMFKTGDRAERSAHQRRFSKAFENFSPKNPAENIIIKNMKKFTILENFVDESGNVKERYLTTDRNGSHYFSDNYAIALKFNSEEQAMVYLKNIVKIKIEK